MCDLGSFPSLHIVLAILKTGTGALKSIQLNVPKYKKKLTERRQHCLQKNDQKEET